MIKEQITVPYSKRNVYVEMFAIMKISEILSEGLSNLSEMAFAEYLLV